MSVIVVPVFGYFCYHCCTQQSTNWISQSVCVLRISKSNVFVIIFNLVCTYHAASPPGSEQERLEYALNSKRRVLILALRWANTHTYMLQEEAAPVSFLEVTKSKLSTISKFHNLQGLRGPSMV